MQRGSGRTRPLTARQAEVVNLIAGGRSNREIAAQLGITEDGVKAHVSRLLEKYDAPNRAALVSRVEQAQSAPAAEDVWLRDLLETVTVTLARTVGTTAARSLVQRALKRAAADDPDLTAFSLAAGEHENERGEGDLQGSAAVRAFDSVMRDLWPLLLAVGGEVLARQLPLEQIERTRSGEQEDVP